MKESPLVLLVSRTASFGSHLREQGFHVAHAADLASGIASFRNGNFALVVLDLDLPDCKGLESLRRFHQISPSAPVIVLADSQKDVVLESIYLGAQDCLVKETLESAALGTAVRKTMARQKFHHSGNGDRTLLNALMQHMPDSIYFKDLESRFLMMGRAQSKKFGLKDPAEAIGKTDHDFFSKDHADQALADEREIMRTGKPMVGIEERETWPDGSETWVSTTKMPLRNAEGRIVGTFGISRDITERKRMQDALTLRTRQLEQKNQQIAEELQMARELQMAMLPQEFPAFRIGKSSDENALEFFSFYYPNGAVSGDFFTITPLSESKVGVFICDVMGHDVRAALVTAMMRSLVQDLSATATTPGDLLARINHNLFSIFKQTGATMYATAFYLVADIVAGEVQYACAAHPDPLQVRRRDGSVKRLGANGVPGPAKGPALGLFENAKFPTHSRKLEQGDLIAMYTDGLIEIDSGNENELFSSEHLTDALRRRAQLPAADLLKGVISEIHDFAGRLEFSDDVCLVGMEFKRIGEN